MPLQHSGYKKGGFDLQLRASLVGVRVVGRLTGPDDVGTWLVDGDSPGDIHGGQLWKKTSRPVPMWRFATPVVIGKGANAGPPGTVASPGGGNGTPPGSAGFVFGGVNTDFTNHGPQAGITLDGGTPNFSNGGPQTGAVFTDPPPAPDANAGTFGFRPPGSGMPGSSAPGIQSDPVMNGGDGPPPTTNGGAPVATVDESNKKCGVRKSPANMLPIMDENFTGDTRLEAVPAVGPKPKKGQKGWPKIPDGMVGISLIGNDEDRQVDLFFPTDPRLISVNYAGDKDMGTPVFDLTEKFEIDGERGVALQSMMRVVKKPMGEENALAWQLGPSGCGDVKGGYVFDKKNTGEPDPPPPVATGQKPPGTTQAPVSTGAPGSGGFSPQLPNVQPGGNAVNGFDHAQSAINPDTANGAGGGGSQLNAADPTPGPANGGKDASTKLVVGRAGRNDGGPLDVGSGKCRHVVGRDADGNPVSKLHISHDFLLRQNDIKDGPLTITTWKPGSAQSKPVPVNFGWNPQSKKWDWWSTTYVYYPPPPPDDDDYMPDCEVRGDCPPDMGPACPPCSSPPPPPSSPPPCPPCGVATPGGSGGGMPGQPVATPTPTPAPVVNPIFRGAPQKSMTNPGERVKTGFTMRHTLYAPSKGTDYGYAMTDISTATGEQLAKPYNYEAGMPDIRYMRYPFENAGDKRALEHPITGVMAAFGAQGGGGSVSNVSPSPFSPPPPYTPPTPPPGPPAPPPPPSPVPSPPTPPPTTPPSSTPYSTGAFGDPWNYTHKPRQSRYRGGTANGGWVILPPEVGLEMIGDGLVPRSGLTRSETYFGVGPGARFFAAIPDLTKGRPKDGLSWGPDATNGDLLMYSHFTGDAGVEAFRFGRTSQRLGFKSRSSYYGNLGHFNSAERTWIFPDISGNVLVSSTIELAAGGAAATLANIPSSGFASAAQVSWVEISVDGTRWAIPAWLLT